MIRYQHCKINYKNFDMNDGKLLLVKNLLKMMISREMKQNFIMSVEMLKNLKL